MNDIYVGNGILDQIKPPEPVILTVELLYERWGELYWPILDDILSDRKDLQERIKIYKDKYGKSIQHKTLESS